jgi:hypothetical protein
MLSLVPAICNPHRRSVRPFYGIAALVSLLFLTPATSFAQSVELTHTEDAAPVPRGMLRARITTGWTRFDERFTTNGLRSLSDELSTDSLGSRQFPALVPVEQALRTLANNPSVRLSFGRLNANSDARVVTTPIALEYGVTQRLSIGVLVPVVQTRRNVQLTVNPDSGGNVGYLQSASQRVTAATTNAQVYAAFRRAADSIGALLTRCPTNPNAAGCAAVNANAADAASARLQAQRFADALNTSLGIDTARTLIAPRTNSALASFIDAQRRALNVRVQQYLGASAGSTTGVFTTPSPFTAINLQGRNGIPGLLQSPLGGGLDSITTINHLGIGDVQVGAQYLLVDGFSRDTFPIRGVQTRLAIGGAFRFATSLVDSTKSTLGIPMGDGAGFELHSAMDVIAGHFGGTVVARYVQSFARTVTAPLVGDPEAPFPAPLFGKVQRTAGTVIGLDVTPRFLLGDWLALDGHYGIERVGPTTWQRPTPVTTCTGCETLTSAPNMASRTSQRVGLGLRYSTANAFRRGLARYPVEVSYTHLETFTGDPGVPLLSRDQIQLRLFLTVLDAR